MTLRRNDKYWGTRAHLDAIEIRLVPDSAAQVDALANGEADLIAPPPNADLVKNVERLPSFLAWRQDLLNVQHNPTAEGPFWNAGSWGFAKP